MLANFSIQMREIIDYDMEIYEFNKMVKNIACLFELYYRLRKTTPLFASYSLYTLNANSNFTNAKAKKDLDYQTRSIKYTIKDLVNEIKSNK